jgi:alkylation response protein AidB-like acyl-CoA dehydrogenase
MSDSKKGASHRPFGSSVPWAEPSWYAGNLRSPYYSDSHVAFRAKVREFVETKITPFVSDWDEEGGYPLTLHQDIFNAGISGFMWPDEFGGQESLHDAFHDLIFIDEVARCGSMGVLYSCIFSIVWSLPPILQYGSPMLKNKLARDVISGKKIMALAISEPFAGSDVAALRTTAVLSDCKRFYIVNGSKKWISSGTKADYFTVAVRTGGPGMEGISMMLMEKGMPGFGVRRMKTQGAWSSGTAFLTFEDVKVPAEYLIGKENAGFKPILKNFNHERLLMSGISNRSARLCIEKSVAYARQRKTFGNRLIDHQVIRHKLVEMARMVESTHCLLEHLTYQYSQGVPDKYLGGPLAMLKVQSTQVCVVCVCVCEWD